MPEILDKATIKALGADTRQEIIKLLGKRPHTASEIAKKLGKHVTTVTEHLDVLEHSGLIGRKESTNKWVYYELSAKGEKLFKPAYYTWIVVFSLSLLMLFAGLHKLFVVGTYSMGYSSQAKTVSETDQSRKTPVSTVAPAAQPAFALSDVHVGFLLVTLALLGFGYLFVQRRKGIA